MNDLAMSIQPYLNQYGYWAVFLSIFLEDFGLPLPGETILVTASLLAAHGNLNIFLLLAIAWFAAVFGDNVGYAIGRYGGRRFVIRYGHRVLITQKRLEYAENFFCRYGGIVVMAARFFEVLRQLNGIAAGIVRMPWWKFVLYNVLGAGLWVGFWGIVSFKLGQYMKEIGSAFQNLELIVLATFLTTGIAVTIHLLRKKSRKKKSPDSDNQDPPPPCKIDGGL